MGRRVWAGEIRGGHGGKRGRDGVHGRDVSIVWVYYVVVGRADVLGVGRWLIVPRRELKGV